MKQKLSLLLLAVVCSTATAMATDNKHELPSDSTSRTLDQLEVVAAYPKPQALARIDVPLSKLPMTISRIDLSQMSLRGLHNPTEALRFATGASFNKSYGAFLRLNVRGFSDSPIIVDGVRDERSTINSYPLGDLSDVESIEVLKGPASVLQGHSAVGGVLSISRRRPSAVTRFNTRLEYGSWEQFRSMTSITGRVAEGWTGLAGFTYASSKGWRDLGDKRLKLYGALFGSWGNDRLELRAGLHNDFYGTEIGLPPTIPYAVHRSDNHEIHLQPWQLQPGLRRDARYNNESDEMYNKNWNISAKWTHTFSDNLKLSNQLSYNDDIIDYFGTEELTYPSKDFAKDKLPKDAPYKYYYDFKKKGVDTRRYIDLDHVQLTFPLRFAHYARTLQNHLQVDASAYTGSFKHNLAAGYSLSYMRRTSFSGYDLGTDVQGPGLNSIVSVHDPHSMGYMVTRFSNAKPSRTYSHGLFVQDVIEFCPKLQALAALRYDLYHYERASVDAIDGKPDFKDPARDKYQVAKSKSLTYRFGLVYTPIKKVNIYASLANFYHPYQTFYSPTVVYVDADGKIFDPNKTNGEVFKPRKGYQIELGTRAEVSDWLSLTASAYLIEQHNLVRTLKVEQVETEQNGKKKTMNVSYRGQVGTITSKGLELDARLTPMRGLLIVAGYSFNDARYTKLTSNPYNSDYIEQGDLLSGIPQHKWFTYGGYMFESGALKGVEAHYSLSYMGKRYRNYKQGIAFDPHTLLDLGLSYRLNKSIRIGADVYNLLNTESFQESLGNQLVPSQPRSFKVNLTYSL